MNVKMKRTRRNVIRAGAILASAAVANVAAIKTSVAGQGGNGQGGNSQGGNSQGQNGGNCLLRGTTIQAAAGNRKIEDLAVGDLLPTVFGGQRPIRWITRYPFKKSDPSKPWVKAVRPIRVARSALGPDVPHTDLYLTEWHSLFIDGVLIPVGSLINGATIKLDEREPVELEFFNIKLETHDVIYAEGAPVETQCEVDERAVNFAEYLRKYGAPRTDEVLCAPIAPYGGRGELRSRLRSAISPWLDRREPIDVIRDRLEERAVGAIV
jgi:hypothetical protein